MLSILLKDWKRILVESSSYCPLIFIIGPTATGKSDLAMSLAVQNQASIVNADSVQVFKSTDIGTAKPTLKERALVKHYLFDFVEEGDTYTAGRYYEDSRNLIEKNKDSKSPLIFVGGSGFYVQALEKGMFDVENPTDEVLSRIQTIENNSGAVGLYEELKKQDSKYAQEISEHDLYRVKRALEMMFMKNKSMCEIQVEFEQEQKIKALKNPILKIGVDLDRKELRKKVQLRVEKMIAAGLELEVRDLLGKGLENWSPMKSVGYLETVQFIKGDLTQQLWPEKIVQNTMRLAKKQRTWFRRDKTIQWVRKV